MSFFSYNNGVPNAPNNPSQDQPLMLVNTQSINGIIQQDHIGFGASNGGVHKQVRFAQNIGKPGIAAGWVSALYTNNSLQGTPIPGGQSWPLWQNSSGAQLIVGPSVNQLHNGYILIGAYMFQWGADKSVNVGGKDGQVPITFTPAFSQTPYVIQMQINGISTDISRFAYFSNDTVGGMTGYVTDGNAGKNGVTVNWLAIGLR